MPRAILLVLTLLLSGSALADEQRNFIPDQPFDMQHIRLDLEIDLPAERVEAVATLTMTALEPATVIELDAVDFQIREITGQINGQGWDAWPHHYDGERLGVFLPAGQSRGTPITLRIGYVVEEPESGLSFFSPEKNGTGTPLQVWSQGESIENRYWVPCFDHPNEMQTTEIVATVAAGFEALSNGALKERRQLADGRIRFHWKMSKPHVVYLMTLVVGEFHVAEESWRGIPVTYYVPPDRSDEVEPTFRHTTAMLDFFTDKLGVRYPWEKYAQVCCHSFGGGMENTSATTLGEASLLDEHTRLDRDSDGLIAHELAHQWFGDLVTCRDWAHLWLNEGFASYFEALWDEHVYGGDGLAWNMMEKAASAIRGGRELPIVHRGYSHPDRQFDARAYPKGAWVVHMLRRELGDEVFWRGLEAYLREFAHQPVESADLRRVLERVSGRSLERFFYDWTERPGHPVLKLDYRWVAEEGLAEVSVEQAQDGEAFVFPLVIDFVTATDTVRLHRRLAGKQETFLVPLASRPERISVDPEMRVLMELTETKPTALWLAQMTDDVNPARRVQAVRHLKKNLNEDIAARMIARLPAERFWAVRGEIVEALTDSDADPTRDALLAALADDDARVRVSAVDNLVRFDNHDPVRERILALPASRSESYAVRAAAIRALQEWNPDDLLERLRPLLAVDDPRSVVRSAAVEALGATARPEAVDLLLEYAGEGWDGRVRRTAVRALGSLHDELEPDAETTNRIATALAACLSSGSRWLESAAARTLGQLGPDAAGALPMLRAALEDDPGERTREVIEQAIAKIDTDGDEPAVAAAAPADELTAQNERLREKLAALEGEYEELEGRVESLEALLRGYETVLDQLRASRAASSGAGASDGAGN